MIKLNLVRSYKKIKFAFKVIKHFKNWPTFFKDHFKLLGKKKIIYYLKNGIRFDVRSRTVDHGIISEVWIHQIYTPKELKVFEIKENDIVLDIGAHIGIFSIFASKFAEKGKIFSFEPIVENFELLNKNIELNKIENIYPINKAVSDKNGEEIMFFDESNNTGAHSFFDHSKSKTKIKVPTISLESIIENNKISIIDFLKMDCEGGEYKILFNCSKEIFEKIRKISLECHDIDAYNNVETLKKFLENNGFKTIIKNDYCQSPLHMLYAYKIK